MKGTTHAITGALLAAAILEPSVTVRSMSTVLACGGIAALIPDIDLTNSKITHYITRNRSNSAIIQNILKISILNIIGFITSIYIFNSLYPLILSTFLSALSLTPHRTLSHSVLSLGVILFLLSKIITNNQILLAIGIGYASHLLEDMLNVTGVPLLYPIYFKKQRIPIVRDEITELIFCIVISALSLFKLFAI